MKLSRPFKYFLILVSIAAVTAAVLYFGLGYRLRVELAGDAKGLFFSVRRPEKHYTTLERRGAPEAPAPSPALATEILEEKKQPPSLSPASRGTTFPTPYWTDFRGPNRDGRYAESSIPADWPFKGLKLLWRQPIGGGYASFVVAEGRAFTIEQRREREVVVAYGAETGRELWTHAWAAHFSEIMGGDGPRATPTWHEGRLYALGAEGELRVLDAATGKLVWSRNILSDNQAENLHWGMSAAPLIVDDKVIVLPGGHGGKSVVAYNKITGEPVWKVLDDKQAYTSPMLVKLAGRRQILVVSARRIVGLDTSDGALLWEYPWTTEYDINCAQPIMLGENRIFISAGYGHGCAVVEIQQNGEGYSARTVWQNNQMKNKFNSSVLHEGYIYGMDESILACIDSKTGERKWKGGRYGYGQLLIAGAHLLVLTESGELVMVRATPEKHKEIARIPALDGKSWNHPAIAGGRLFVRNTTEMAAFKINSF